MSYFSSQGIWGTTQSTPPLFPPAPRHTSNVALDGVGRAALPQLVRRAAWGQAAEGEWRLRAPTEPGEGAVESGAGAPPAAAVSIGAGRTQPAGAGLAPGPAEVVQIEGRELFHSGDSSWRCAEAGAAQGSASSSKASTRKLTGRNPSLQESMADLGFFIQPS